MLEQRFETLTDAVNNLTRAILAFIAAGTGEAQPAQLITGSAAAPSTAVNAGETKAGKVKAAKPAAAESAAEQTAEVEAPTFTIEDCQNALKKVAVKFGVPNGRSTAIAIIKHYVPSAKVFEVDPKDYADLIKRCEATIAEGVPVKAEAA